MKRFDMKTTYWKIILSRIAVLISFIVLSVILLTSQTYATSNTFSVYGHVQYENGTYISGTTIKLFEPIDNTSKFNDSMPAIQSTMTDNNGNYQFINVTTNYSICGIYNYFPVNSQYAVPYYFITVNTSGVQYINIIDSPPPSPANPPTSPPSTGIYVIIGLGIVCLFGLFCLYKALYHKK